MILAAKMVPAATPAAMMPTCTATAAAAPAAIFRPLTKEEGVLVFALMVKSLEGLIAASLLLFTVDICD